MELVPLHGRVAKEHKSITEEAVAILNDEWPRSEALRLRSIESSSDNLPAFYALIQWFGKRPSVLGTARLSRIPSDPQGSVWVETVCLHPGLRGKGLGKYLMHKVDEECLRLGFDKAYLCTVDKQVFYSRVGYKFCDPICSYGGNVKLPEKLQNLQKKETDSKPKNSTEVKAEPRQVHAEAPVAPPPPGPPPPPPPPIIKLPEAESKSEELIALCEKLYQVPVIPKEPPLLDQPPAQIKPKEKSNNSNVCCRVTLKKDYMLKCLR